MLFPLLFPRYRKSEDELCEVISIVSGITGSDQTEGVIEHSAFIITLENRHGARGKINVGTILSRSPWTKLRIGDKVLATTKTKELFRFEMKILKLKEIYHAADGEPVILAA